MCRNQSDQAATVYKPLGALKRCMVKRPTYGERHTLTHFHIHYITTTGAVQNVTSVTVFLASMLVYSMWKLIYEMLFHGS